MTRSHRLHHYGLHLAPRHYLPGSLIDMGTSLVQRSPPGFDNSASSGGGSSDSESDAGFGSSSKSKSDSDSSDSTSSGFGSSNTCAPGDNRPKCQRPVSALNSQTLPIVLAVVIPVVFALVLFFFLHRRHVRKLRREDANDKHKSLDFGMDPSAQKTKPSRKRGKKGAPEMSAIDISATEKDIRHGGGHNHGMSIDMGSPYLLPPDLHGSRESLHSLSRTIHSGDDRYRTATNFIPNDSSSLRSYPASTRRFDDASSYAGSHRGGPDGMNQELLRNASRMSRSSPPFSKSPSPPSATPAVPVINAPDTDHTIVRKGLPSNPKDSGLLVPSQSAEEPRDSYIDKDGGDMRRSNNYLGAFINPRDSSIPPNQMSGSATSTNAPYGQADKDLPITPQPVLLGNDTRTSPPPAIAVVGPPPRPERPRSMEAPVLEMPTEPYMGDDRDYGQGFKVTPASPRTSDEMNPGMNHSAKRSLTHDDKPLPPVITGTQDDPDSLNAPDLGYDIRRLSMGVRPLPPDDPTDDPEQRANRIRSFYKEYFDESKPGPAGYYEDYGQEYLGDAPYFDPDSGNFVMGGAPYAEPYTRRAMTPPPRAPPRFRGAHRPNQFSASGSMGPPRSRAYSSASAGGLGPAGPRGRRPGAKPLPPPSPLRVLPTPHLLKEDSFALPIDFAPPSTFKDRRAGRPESPMGGLRPYSPMLPAHLPLASSFDDLSVMPSPHALRKSGTFTALDFAPPPRFKNSDAGSDAGSIRSGRSNRSAMSAAQVHNIRTGAYRVSRLPKDFVGTKADITSSLKPTWDLK
ncbi:MAG: hypothetical protein M1825_006035 [Sarcosagium campestre]|nr:MAG: hypothetical protein M1825_006035 [Sarcosagium campestre]